MGGWEEGEGGGGEAGGVVGVEVPPPPGQAGLVLPHGDEARHLVLVLHAAHNLCMYTHRTKNKTWPLNK